MAKGVHHFLVSSENPNDLIHLISQTDILKYIYTLMQDNEIYYKHLEMPLSNYNKLTTLPKIVTGKLDSTMSTVLSIMNEYDINSVPVVDAKGSIVDYFSISDLRNFLWDSSRHDFLQDSISILLQMNLKDFLFSSYSSRGGLGNKPAVVATESTHLGECISKAINGFNYLKVGRVHRVWVVDDDLKPVGVVSYTDMIKFLWNMRKDLEDDDKWY
jgi:CBS domain-containing protein